MRCQSALELHNYRTNPTILYRLVSQTTARHTLVQSPQQNGCMGTYMVIDLEQFPVRISTDKAPTPLTTLGILFSPVFLLLFLSLSFLSFCLSLYSHVRFMAFQSLLVGTTPAFTIIINNKRSLLGQYIGIL